MKVISTEPATLIDLPVGLLSDRTIKKYLKSGKLVIDPIDIEEQVQPASVDLKLGNTFGVINPIKTPVIDFTKPIEYDFIQAAEFWLMPGHFALGTTKEYLELPADITGFLEGRSSVGRSALFIHNAGLIDAGFIGQVTLEFFNCGPVPILLKPEQRICQIAYYQMDQEAENPYNGKYQGQRGATGSRIHLDHLKG